MPFETRPSRLVHPELVEGLRANGAYLCNNALEVLKLQLIIIFRWVIRISVTIDTG